MVVNPLYLKHLLWGDCFYDAVNGFRKSKIDHPRIRIAIAVKPPPRSEIGTERCGGIFS
jgi:hypothetical protein